MALNGTNDLGRAATTLLATVVVIIFGLCVCAFILLAFTNDPGKPMLFCILTALSCVLLSWLLRDKPKNQVKDRSVLWLLGFRRRKKTVVYQLVRRDSTKPKKYGTNQPPSVKTIQFLNEAARESNWVPSGPAVTRPNPSGATSEAAELARRRRTS